MITPSLTHSLLLASHSCVYAVAELALDHKITDLITMRREMANTVVIAAPPGNSVAQ
jgi:hypothetical protein